MKCKFGSQLAVMICAIKTTERQHRAAARVCKCTQTHMHSTYAYIHMHTLTYLYNYINYIYVLYCFVLFVRTEFFKSFYLFSFVIFISLFMFFFSNGMFPLLCLHQKVVLRLAICFRPRT